MAGLHVVSACDAGPCSLHGLGWRSAAVPDSLAGCVDCLDASLTAGGCVLAGVCKAPSAKRQLQAGRACLQPLIGHCQLKDDLHAHVSVSGQGA